LNFLKFSVKEAETVNWFGNPVCRLERSKEHVLKNFFRRRRITDQMLCAHLEGRCSVRQLIQWLNSYREMPRGVQEKPTELKGQILESEKQETLKVSSPAEK
jgi:hypothetical protein